MKKLIVILGLTFLYVLNTYGQHFSRVADSLRLLGNYKLELRYRQLSYKANPQNSASVYNLACCYSLLINSDSAFIYLDEAIRLGKDDGWALADSDFRNLHNDERWREVESKLKDIYIKKNTSKHPELAWQISKMFFEDQAPKVVSDNIMVKYGIKSVQMDSINRIIVNIDSLNMINLENIFDLHGWTGKDLVGLDAADKAFIIILHAPLFYQKKYFGMINTAISNGDIRKSSIAYLTDKILTKEGKKQLYGTQLKYSYETKSYDFKPIDDEKNVNKRRSEIGLGPLEDYAKNFGFEYKQK